MLALYKSKKICHILNRQTIWLGIIVRKVQAMTMICNIFLLPEHYYQNNSNYDMLTHKKR